MCVRYFYITIYKLHILVYVLCYITIHQLHIFSYNDNSLSLEISTQINGEYFLLGFVVSLTMAVYYTKHVANFV